MTIFRAPAAVLFLFVLASLASAEDSGKMLRDAVRANDMAKVQELLKTPGTDVNSQSTHGQTALHVAASRGLEEIVKALLASGARLDVKDEDGHTPLDLAKAKGQTAVCELLQPKTDSQPQRPLDSRRAPSADGPVLDLGKTEFTAKTSTGSGTSDGITYTIDVKGTLALAAKNLSIVVAGDSVSLVVLRVHAPTATKEPFTLDLDLDEEPREEGSPQLQVVGSTSLGLRGKGEMPTMLHPRTELVLKDKTGDYGSALYIRKLEVLAFVSKPLFTKDDKSRAFVVAAFDFQPEQRGEGGAGSTNERTYKASSVTVWRYEREFLSSLVNDPKAESNRVQTAKVLLERLQKK